MSERYSDSEKKWKIDVVNSPKRDYSFKSGSGEDVDLLYYPDNSSDYIEKLNFPGEFPYTRGIHSNMYRGKLWTMRQFAGFGSPKETNDRFKLLLSQGQTGLSVAFDMPTLMGYDADHSLSEGEVGRCGVAISSLKDMEILFDGIDLSNISVSMTINGPAPIILAFFLNAAIDQQVERHLQLEADASGYRGDLPSGHDGFGLASVGKRGDEMVSALMNNEPIGFLQLIIKDKVLFIDLIGVDKKAQGKGVASAMIQFAKFNIECSVIKVGTQIANLPSIKLDQKIGFLFSGSDYVFHYHSK